MAMPILILINRLLLLILSASAPAGKPSKRKGAIRRAKAVPTNIGESVNSKTSHPSTTCSPWNPTELNTPDNQRNLKSLNFKAGAEKMFRRRGMFLGSILFPREVYPIFDTPYSNYDSFKL